MRLSWRRCWSNLLGCPACVARAETNDAYVDAVRAAAVLFDRLTDVVGR